MPTPDAGAIPIASADDHALAARLAEEAGELLLRLREELQYEGSATLKREGDRRAHDLLVRRLAEERPGDAVLSEEGRDRPERLASPRTWIVDPLDGTREFSEPPRVDWAVHVALVAAEHPIAGAVALPAQGITLSTAHPSPTPPPPPTPPRVIVSRSRPPMVALAIAEALGADLVEMGSAGAKVAAVVQGVADVYPHAGGQYEWDSCAPVAVAAAAGLHCSRIDGTPLRYNQPDPWLPDLLVCPPHLVDEILEVTRGGAY
ncbi:3'(2'),5'-bisphosphate nucleotidase CysQ [Iamia sp. SCSIO 61187]|uniref:3'(2'),5'-bisphosphate nucleotidase CysQ n=1 Tax=Iamia sp. SCSIO 61187 TaxID=2722752 RepID=UPI001C63442F|nr:3'(2'),5'-bisphosphate nucleotidase CysQ [Iamia sp. SCSIO 61187]QYG92597.1 3'(2'),5'-bisphosphate nucleotidase CysQ [Iamia sp. SCSIO 61187]